MSEHTPEVSIGMPVYNGERYLNEALDSLLGQTFSEFELIISDNASTDATEELCRKYAGEDNRIRYFRNQSNLGLAENYCRVFELAQGRFFKWASTDDICQPQMIEKCRRILEANPDAVLCYPRTIIIDQLSAVISPFNDGLHLTDSKPADRFRKLIDSLRLNNAMNGLIRAEALEKTSLIKGYLASDINMMVELCLLGKFYECPEPLFLRRVNLDELQNKKKKEKLLKYYDTSKGRKISLQYWRLNFEHIRSIRKAPLARKEKIHLYWLMMKKYYWESNVLKNELILAAKSRIKPHGRN